MKRSAARSKSAIDFAKGQRRTANEFADTVWQWLRDRRCCDVKFRREVPIPPYTVDFCCLQQRIIIEVDGSPHLTPAGRQHDQVRDSFLASQGFHILRVAGYSVTQTPFETDQQITDFVRSIIAQTASANDSGSPRP